MLDILVSNVSNEGLLIWKCSLFKIIIIIKQAIKEAYISS